MVGFVTIPIHQNDIVRLHQRLNHNLVTGRCAIGGKKRLPCAKRTRRRFLRMLDRTMGIQQRIQSTRCGRGFRQEDVHPIKVAHILDPMGLGNGFPTADRHGMKHTGRLLGIFLQGGKERRLIARVDPAQDVQMQLHIVFLIIEDPAAILTDPPCNILHGLIRDHIDIQFRTQLPDGIGQIDAKFFRRQIIERLVAQSVQVAFQHWQIVAGFIRKAIPHNDGLNVVIEQHTNQRIFKTADNHAFIDKGILRPAFVSERPLQRGFLMG